MTPPRQLAEAEATFDRIDILGRLRVVEHGEFTSLERILKSELRAALDREAALQAVASAARRFVGQFATPPPLGINDALHGPERTLRAALAALDEK